MRYHIQDIARKKGQETAWIPGWNTGDCKLLRLLGSWIGLKKSRIKPLLATYLIGLDPYNFEGDDNNLGCCNLLKGFSGLRSNSINTSIRISLMMSLWLFKTEKKDDATHDVGRVLFPIEAETIVCSLALTYRQDLPTQPQPGLANEEAPGFVRTKPL